MNHQFTLMTVFLLSFIAGGMSSECVYEETVFYLEKLEILIQATCYEVNSELSPNLNHENATLSKILRVTTNSKIPRLQPSSTLGQLTALRVLGLSSAKIEEILPGVFDSLDKLTDINLSNNLLKNIPAGVFNKLVKLEKLDLSKNQLSKISAGTFDNLKSLWWLYLSENRITRLEDGSFTDLISLSVLKLQENKITVLQEGIFRNLTNLSLLDISENPIEEIQDVGFNGREFAVLAIETNLKKFEVNISRSSVTRLELPKGQLEEFDFANLNPTIDYLSLSKNRLITVKNLQLTSANTVELDHNNLTEIRNVSPKTVGLFLQHNLITHVAKIEDPSSYRMMFLDLSFNQLESASCFGLPRLIDLQLQNNQISAITQNDFLGCPTLYKLNLGFNKIETIEANAFKNLNVLQNLLLSNNRLKNLNPENFVGLNSLEVIYFDNNTIGSLDVEKLSQSFPELARVKISGNSIQCEDLEAITLGLKQHNIRIFDENSENAVQCTQK